jgi:putative endonuclease
MTTNQDLGRRGERAAAEHYRRLGFDVALNWRTDRGEIDLICTRGGLVVFCEVKTRRSTRFGSGVDAVGPAKQARVRRLAGAWLSAQSEHFDQVRFDVVDVDGRGHLQVYEDGF